MCYILSQRFQAIISEKEKREIFSGKFAGNSTRKYLFAVLENVLSGCTRTPERRESGSRESGSGRDLFLSMLAREGTGGGRYSQTCDEGRVSSLK